MSYLALKDEPEPAKPVVVKAERVVRKSFWNLRRPGITYFNFKNLWEAIMIGIMGGLR